MPLIACASVRTPHAAVSRSQAGSGRGLAVAASASHTPAPSRESGRNSGLRASAGLANSGMCGSRPCGSGACGSGACGSGLCCSGLGASAGTAQPSGLNNVVPALHIGFVIRHQAVLRANSGAAPSCSIRGLTLYAAALEYARSEQYEVARRVFAKAVEECPGYLKPWVSWAQMEKRCIPKGDDRRWEACRQVLHRGLRTNPDAPPILQAWGLLEMQRGNWTAALKLLDRSAQLEPRNRPVLRWKPVIEARRTLVSGRVQRKRMRVHSSE